VAAQGVVCAAAFERRNVSVDLIPPRVSMGALIVEIAKRVDDTVPAEPVPGSGGSVAVLAGKSRSGDRLVEQVCLERGVAVECIPPSRTAGHPADDVIRRATRVVIISGRSRRPDVGRVLRLAERYAKPIQIIDPSTLTR
jgi:hypothetical protein